MPDQDFGSDRAASGDIPLAAHGLVAGYGGRPILNGLDVQIRAGRLTVLAGPNGSGKSTLLMTLARVLAPMAGGVMIDGQPIGQIRARSLAQRLAVLPQNPPSPEGLSVFELVSRGRYPHQGPLGLWRARDMAAVRAALTATGMSDLADRPLAALSGGQRQRAWIAMAIAQETGIILLDEPTSALDLRYQVEIMELLRRLAREGKTVVAVIHDLNLAATYSDDLVLLKAGKIIAAGPTPQICAPQIIGQCFDLPMEMLSHPSGGRPVLVPART